MSNKIEIVSSENVTANTKSVQSILIANKQYEVMGFTADSPIQDNTCVSLIWDYLGVDEKYIWTIWANEPMPFKYRGQGDGTKKLSLVLVNDEPNSVIVSGHLVIRELGK